MLSISERAKSLKGSPIRRLTPLANAAKKRGIAVYHLNIGQPDIPTPTSFMDGVRNAKVDVLSYSPATGIAETIDAMCAYYAELGIQLAHDELIVTIGGSEAFCFALQATCNPGDEVLIPEPFYPNYVGHSVMNGNRVVPITTRIEDGFHLPPMVEIEKLITPSTRERSSSRIRPTRPASATRATRSPGSLKLALKHNLFIISDEPYRELMYDGEAVSIMSFPELAQNAILVDSISKRLSACGARIGCLATRNKEVLAAVNKLCQIRLSPPTFEQLGLVAFLRDRNHKKDIARSCGSSTRAATRCSTRCRRSPDVVCREARRRLLHLRQVPADRRLRGVRQVPAHRLPARRRDGDGRARAPTSTPPPAAATNEVRVAYVLEEPKLVRAVEVLKAGLAAYVEEKAGVAAR